MKPKVSVVIPTLNGGPALRRCVESVVASTYPKELIELVVVGDGCSENPEDAMSGLGEKCTLKVILQDQSGPAVARNRGLNYATGSLIAFTDDDCIVDREWLSNIVERMTDSRISGIGGRTRSADGGIQATYMDRVNGTDPVLLETGEPWYLVTANCCFRRDVILEAGGFDPAFPLAAAEDVDLSLRLHAKGHALTFDPGCRVSHHYDGSLGSLIRRFHRYGLGTRILFDKHLIWREWKPDAANRLYALLCGTDQGIREFIEIEDIDLRLWCGLLDRLHHIMYLAGYCQIGTGADLEALRGRSEVETKLNESLLPFGGGRREMLQELGQLLESGRNPEEKQDGERSWIRQLFTHARRSQDFRLWSGFVSGLLDLDDLLGFTVHRARCSPSIPDTDMDPDTRKEWLQLCQEQEQLYGNRCARVLCELPNNLFQTDFEVVQSACDRYKVNTPRFFAWREAILRQRSGVVDHLAVAERESVLHFLQSTSYPGEAAGASDPRLCSER